MRSQFIGIGLFVLILSTQVFAGGAQITSSCGSMRWIVSIHSPASAEEIATFFQTLATDQFQPVLKLHRFTANGGGSQAYSVRLVAEFQFENVGLYSRDEAIALAVKSIEDVKKIPNTRVFCDSLSKVGGPR